MGQAIVVGVVALGVWYAGNSIVHGAKWVGHKTKAGIHKIIPHHAKPQGK